MAFSREGSNDLEQLFDLLSNEPEEKCLPQIRELITRIPDLNAIAATDNEDSFVYGETLLGYSVRMGYIRTAELLLEKGASPNQHTKSGSFPLYKAMGIFTKGLEQHRTAIVRLLLNYHANPDLFHLKLGKTALYVAAQRNLMTEFNLLVERGADVNCQGGDGKTSLHYAVIEKNKVLVELLLQKGADRNIRDHAGHAPLHYALVNQDLNLVSLLLDEKNLTVNPKELYDFFATQDQSHPTVALWVTQRNYFEMLNTLHTSFAELFNVDNFALYGIEIPRAVLQLIFEYSEISALNSTWRASVRNKPLPALEVHNPQSVTPYLKRLNKDITFCAIRTTMYGSVLQRVDNALALSEKTPALAPSPKR